MGLARGLFLKRVIWESNFWRLLRCGVVLVLRSAVSIPFQISVLSFIGGRSIFGVCGGVVFCNAPVLFTVPRHRFARAGFSSASAATVFLSFVLSGCVRSWVPMGPETRHGINELSIGCISEGGGFDELLGPLQFSLPILHQDPVSQTYGNQTFPCLRLVVRKCVVQLYELAWQ